MLVATLTQAERACAYLDDYDAHYDQPELPFAPLSRIMFEALDDLGVFTFVEDLYE